MRWQPLDRLPSIKLKLSVVIIGAIAIAAAINSIGLELGPVWVRPAHLDGDRAWRSCGSSRGESPSPLREMAGASTQMAQGEYETRVTESSSDEVGDLARAFNAMAARLAEVDQERRDLVAMVSHELRHTHHRTEGQPREHRRRAPGPRPGTHRPARSPSTRIS